MLDDAVTVTARRLGAVRAEGRGVATSVLDAGTAAHAGPNVIYEAHVAAGHDASPGRAPEERAGTFRGARRTLR